MTVTNVNGISATTCKCRNWLYHWKKFGGGSTPLYCPVTKCFEKGLVGTHVQKDSATDKNWYILPLCKKHNGETGKSLEIGDFVLVSANVSQTCGKRYSHSSGRWPTGL